jgi:hypothetical protein
MFQQTIQDALALADAGPRPEDLLECVRARIASFEPFEAAEIVARTENGVFRFVVAPGLGDVGPKALAALGTEPMLRIDTAAGLSERGLSAPGLSSLLVLRLESARAAAAVIVLGHGRAWSFAAAPLARVRTLGGLALRLLIWNPAAAAAAPDTARLTAEVARLRAQGASLEKEIVALRAERAARKGSDKPR